jgi:hypothetical protein
MTLSIIISCLDWDRNALRLAKGTRAAAAEAPGCQPTNGQRREARRLLCWFTRVSQSPKSLRSASRMDSSSSCSKQQQQQQHQQHQQRQQLKGHARQSDGRAMVTLASGGAEPTAEALFERAPVCAVACAVVCVSVCMCVAR